MHLLLLLACSDKDNPSDTFRVYDAAVGWDNCRLDAEPIDEGSELRVSDITDTGFVIDLGGDLYTVDRVDENHWEYTEELFVDAQPDGHDVTVTGTLFMEGENTLWNTLTAHQYIRWDCDGTDEACQDYAVAINTALPCETYAYANAESVE